MFHRAVKIFLFVISAAIVLSAFNALAADAGFSYKVSFTGIKDDESLLSDIKSISDTLANADRQISSEYLLQKMAEADASKFLQLLKARGYYDASVEVDKKTVKGIIELTFFFQLGDAFTLKSVTMEFTDESESGGLKLPKPEKFGLNINKRFTSIEVLEAQEGLIRFLRSKGFALVKIADREVIVDHRDKSATVSFKIDSGPQVVFGHTTISGLVSVDKSYVAGKLPWKEGDPFNGDLVEEARKAISELGLFASIPRISEGKELVDGSKLPITIEVTERKHKSISVGLNYITNQGPGVKFSWENRNLFHSGEDLLTNYELSNNIVTAEGTFKKQDFLKKDQTIRVSLKLGREDTDAYDSTSVIGSGFIERNLTKKVTIGAGASMKSAKEDQLSVTKRYHLFSFPMYCNVDTTNNLLDPVRGHRVSLQVTPIHELTGQGITYVKAIGSYKYYRVLFQKPFVVVAGNIRAGMITGSGRTEIPPDERFYAGGGGSVRGYSYQSVGPLSKTTPLGGKSLLEMSAEVRFKITEHFGLAAFLDGGSAYSNSTLSSNESFLLGTGMGVRYYTPIGPFRLDVGVPLDKRPGIDKSFQIYLSLGQAF
jgi:translocation and assembly module TamA